MQYLKYIKFKFELFPIACRPLCIDDDKHDVCA